MYLCGSSNSPNVVPLFFLFFFWVEKGISLNYESNKEAFLMYNSFIESRRQFSTSIKSGIKLFTTSTGGDHRR